MDIINEIELVFLHDVHASSINNEGDRAIKEGMYVEGRTVTDEPDDVGEIQDDVTYTLKRYFKIVNYKILDEVDQTEVVLKRIFSQYVQEGGPLYDLLQREGYKLIKDE